MEMDNFKYNDAKKEQTLIHQSQKVHFSVLGEKMSRTKINDVTGKNNRDCLTTTVLANESSTNQEPTTKSLFAWG